MKVSVIGAGSWGTAIASIVANNYPVKLWARNRALVSSINLTRRNPTYLPGVDLPIGITATHELAEATDGAELLIWAVPSHGYRAVLQEAASHISEATPIVSLAKGIESETLMRMTEVTADVLPAHDPSRLGVLSGPNLAREVAAGQPTASVIAFEDASLATNIQAVLTSPTFRVYTNTDVVGAESAGALKNVMAIAAGMATGLGFGNNTLATLITRALAELTRLGTALGGQSPTFAGLAGMGDLIATCVSPESRNHQVGLSLGQGKPLGQAIDEMHMVAEGVKSTRAILDIAKREGVEMPIAEQVGRVLYEGALPADAVAKLMGRAARSESDRLQN